MVRDAEAQEKLIPEMESLLADTGKIRTLEKNILELAKKDASQVIAKEVLGLIG